jgi:hypothetical protein
MGRMNRASKGGLVAPCVLGLALLVCVLVPANAGAEQRATQLVTAGAGTSDGFIGHSADGSRTFFNTHEQLVPEDTDGGCGDEGLDFPRPCGDIYERVSGVPALLSAGPTGGNGPFDVEPFDARISVSTDGSHVFFETAERLVSEDTDNQRDVYERSGGITNLVSTGPVGGNGPHAAFFGGLSSDGAHAFFVTDEELTSDDMDPRVCLDVYERAGGVTKLVSTGPTDGVNPVLSCGAGFAGASDDGSRVFFTTHERFVSEDTDENLDVYERAGGVTRLISTGPAGGNGDRLAFFAGSSADGSHVFFRTDESLVTADADNCGADFGCTDIYERVGGVTRLVSTGPTDSNASLHASYVGASADGRHVFFLTPEQLVSEDGDPVTDEYERFDGTTTRLVTTGPAGGNGPFAPNPNPGDFGFSEDGEDAIFATDESLVSDDTDSRQDVYERVGGTTTRLVSTGPLGGNGDFFSTPGAISNDGGRALFTTPETLTADDGDGGAIDVYERAGGTTTLISTGPTGGSGNFVARFGGSSRDGSRIFFVTDEPLVSEDTDALSDVYVSSLNHPPYCSGVSPDRAALEPANHRFNLVSLGGAEDEDGDPVTLTITSVTQDEPLKSAGDSTSPDAREGNEPGQVYLRAERSARGDGRVYRIAFTASDGRGGTCSEMAAVGVPRHKKDSAYDSAPPSYDSFGS